MLDEPTRPAEGGNEARQTQASSASAALATPAASRAIAGLIFAATFGVLLVAAYLEPSSSGTGTHQQLGLPPCGFLTATGLPCATCGMTTSFSHAAAGDLLAAFLNQPAGAVFALLTAMAAVVSGYALVTGMSLVPLGHAIWRPSTIVALIALLLLGWIYAITQTLLGT